MCETKQKSTALNGQGKAKRGGEKEREKSVISIERLLQNRMPIFAWQSLDRDKGNERVSKIF